MAVFFKHLLNWNVDGAITTLFLGDFQLAGSFGMSGVLRYIDGWILRSGKTGLIAGIAGHIRQMRSLFQSKKEESIGAANYLFGKSD